MTALPAVSALFDIKAARPGVLGLRDVGLPHGAGRRLAAGGLTLAYLAGAAGISHHPRGHCAPAVSFGLFPRVELADQPGVRDRRTG